MSATGINWDTHRHVRLAGPTRAVRIIDPGRIPDSGVLHSPVMRSGSGPATPTMRTPPPEASARDISRLKPRHRADVVGFGDNGTWSALSKGDGTFEAPRRVIADFGRNQSWDVNKHVRLLADVTGDGNADLVGFGDAGAYTALAKGDGTFGPQIFGVDNLGYNQGWRNDRHVRLVADVTGDGRGDLIGFGTAAVFVTVSNGDGTFQTPVAGVNNLCYNEGWRVGEHPRFAADITGDGRADLVGCGTAGTWVCLSRGNGTFDQPKMGVANFGLDQEWRVDRHPRYLADVTGDGKADIVGFGAAGVWVSLSNGDGSFAAPVLGLNNLGYNQGWRVDRHPRYVADVTGDGKADLIGFGDAGVWVALSNGNGTFAQPQLVVNDLGFQQGWRVDKHPRYVADVTGDGRADLVGFGDAGVWTALSNGNGSFGMAQFALADFGANSGSGGVRHVFVLMLENRSFDHMLGFSAITGTDAVTGRPTTMEGLSGTETNPRAGQSDVTVSHGAPDTLTVGPGHDFSDVLEQLSPGNSYPNGGPYPPINNKGYVQNYVDRHGAPDDVMKVYDAAQLPILNQLAREFALCDHWFSSMPGPTFPNRFFLHAASAGGLDHDPSDSEVAKWATVSGKAFPHGHIFQKLDDAGLRYRIYAGDDFPAAGLLEDVNMILDVHDFDEHFADDMGNSSFADLRVIHLEPSYDAFNTYINGSSQHPLADIQAGEAFIKKAYEAIRNSPLWEDSLLIITWDEHGGFFDHVTPPAAIPPGDGAADDNDNGFTFDRLGPRVPAIIVSPRIPRNLIDHRVYDHSSVPAAIERIYALEPLTNRDRAANAPNTLLTLLEPRTDTPATLVSVASSAAPRRRTRTPAELAQPITSDNIEAFLQVAVMTDIKISPAAARPAILARAQAINTYQAAIDYSKDVSRRLKLQRAKVGLRPVAVGPRPIHVG
jgi:hypothetical protein